MVYWLKSIFTNHKKEEKRLYAYYYDLFNNFLTQHNAKLISFEFFYEYFGSKILVFEYKGQMYKCESDRSEIYLNDKLICNSSYRIPGEFEAEHQMMKTIEEKVFQKSEN